jgi:uncharacterized protein (TIGR02246 family)
MTDTDTGTGTEAEAEAEFSTFMHRWSEAIVANDIARMDEFATDDWVLIDKPGIISREGFHAAVASGALTHSAMTHDVLSVRRLRPDVAVVITHGRNIASFQGARIEADEWTSDVLILTDAGWRCALTQLTPREVPFDS